MFYHKDKLYPADWCRPAFQRSISYASPCFVLSALIAVENGGQNKCATYDKIPNCLSSWGFILRSEIKIYLNILELIHAAAGGEGVQVHFRILSGHSEGSELPVNAQFP